MNENSLFQSKSVNENLPRRDRRKLRGLTLFGPDEDGFTIFVTSAAVHALQSGTRKHVPHEAFGMLMGRAYEDEKGIFTVVSDVVYARNPGSSKTHVDLSKAQMYELRKEAQLAHPAVDFVGWTHSHRDFFGYSSIDFKEQRTWTEEYHVGILTFMDSIMGAREIPWAVAYRGPSSHELPLTVDAVTPLIADEDSDLQKRAAERKVSWKNLLSAQKLIQPLFLLFLILAIALGIFLGNLLMLRLQPSHPVASSNTLLWSCDQSSGRSPLKVTCAGPVGPTIQGCIWDFGDGTTINNSIVTHIYEKSGVYTIKLVVLSSTSKLSAGSLNIHVTSSTAA